MTLPNLLICVTLSLVSAFVLPGEAPWIRIAIVSDTHGRIYTPNQMPRADILIHAGDMTQNDQCDSKDERKAGIEVDEFTKTLQWIRNWPASHKIVTFGNHDYAAFHALEHKFPNHIPWTPAPDLKTRPSRELTDRQRKQIRMLCEEDPSFIVLMHENRRIPVGKHHSLNIFGSPLSKFRRTDAFTFKPSKGDPWLGPDGEPVFEDETDLFIFHGPMRESYFEQELGQHQYDLDHADYRENGCEHLRRYMDTRGNIPLVVTGHIHGVRGYKEVVIDGKIAYTLVNPSAIVSGYSAKTRVHKEYMEPAAPVVLDFNLKTHETRFLTYEQLKEVQPELERCNEEKPAPWAGPIIRQHSKLEYPTLIEDVEDSKLESTDEVALKVDQEMLDSLNVRKEDNTEVPDEQAHQWNIKIQCANEAYRDRADVKEAHRTYTAQVLAKMEL